MLFHLEYALRILFVVVPFALQVYCVDALALFQMDSIDMTDAVIPNCNDSIHCLITFVSIYLFYLVVYHAAVVSVSQIVNPPFLYLIKLHELHLIHQYVSFVLLLVLILMLIISFVHVLSTAHALLGVSFARDLGLMMTLSQ